MPQHSLQLGWVEGWPIKIWGKVKQVTLCSGSQNIPCTPFILSSSITVTLETSCTRWCHVKMEDGQLIYLTLCDAAIILKPLKFWD